MGTRMRPRTTRIKPVKILLMHDNRTKKHTAEAHKLARELDNDPKYEVTADYDKWKPKEETSPTETNRREAEMVKEVDIGVRIAPAPSITGEKRHEGAINEMQKLKNASKPILDIYEKGGRASKELPDTLKSYTKREHLNLKLKQSKKKVIDDFVKELEEKK